MLGYLAVLAYLGVLGYLEILGYLAVLIYLEVLGYLVLQATTCLTWSSVGAAIFSPFQPFTLSPFKGASHFFTFSTFHFFTLKCAAIFSLFHLITLSSFKGCSHLFTFSPLKGARRLFTFSPLNIIFSPFHPFTFSSLNVFSPYKKSAPTRRRERSIHKNIDKKS